MLLTKNTYYYISILIIYLCRARPLVGAEDLVVVKAAARRIHAYLLDDAHQLWEFGAKLSLRRVHISIT